METTKKGHPTERKESVGNGVDPALGRPKSSRVVIATKQKLSKMQSSNDLTNKHGKSKMPKKTTSIPMYGDEEFSIPDDSGEEEIDDQTDALLKGFESDDEGDEKDPKDRGYEAGEEIPKVDKKIRKKAKAAEKSSSSGKPGVVYIGRIPHGFYEQEMRQYFSQFGTIANLRLSRNRKTGKSKHFAFIEFESAEVAEIVSKTMDNYLLFGHILKCKMVAPEQVHEKLWVGANRRFKKIPWNKMEGRKLQQGMTEEGWNKRIEREEKRRAEKKAALQLMDYEFESPMLKSVKDISKKSQQSLTIGNEPDELKPEPKATEASEELEVQQQTAKVKKNKKKKSPTDDTKGEKAQDIVPVTESPSKKRKGSTEKFSEQLLGVEEKKKSVSVKDAGSGSAEKAEKIKKSKKHKPT